MPGIYRENLIIVRAGLKIQPEGGMGKKNLEDKVILMPTTGPAIFINIPKEDRC